MSSSVLNILALEPYYDGARRQVLTAIQRYSRHEWTLLKLPARRIDRRLAAASRWFAELIGRDCPQQVDLLFAGEMLNLPDLARGVPRLAAVPSVVYFQANQTPVVNSDSSTPLDFVNLNNAMAASELWFNSQWHLDQFIDRCEALVSRQPEISGRHPRSDLRSKSQVILPPVDLGRAVEAVEGLDQIVRDTRTLLVDTRQADLSLLMECVELLEQRGEAFNLITVGPQKGLPDSLRRQIIHERDEAGQFRAIYSASTYVCLRHGATADELLVPALSAGCWPVVPDVGIFPELVASSAHPTCLHDGTAESIVQHILDGWYTERELAFEFEQDEILSTVDATRACQIIDDLLEEVAAGKGLGTL